ncbi:MAG TPA: transglycosylase SLT domain-containing protein [Ramlibacter sp.]|jgi:soluble lytic murein transglycosylase|uniref:lytic transglycosylase domain-containing protein n=1 Tax=Ramlibacter sp. TaxID=1917967 RepID=UPI002D262AAE|nr:transglycosylase SLT domain-containing protein [Ramlibacter sp.]HZY18862.1 transglycosylase SLT domain-containing protein [Ramlibacter sp.]
MKFRTILTLILAAAAGAAQAQNRGDDVILEMGNAFRQNNKARLAQLLPQARGHVLEPWAAYWELRARLDTATPQEIQDFFARYAGTYQEDRLRNDWLLLLGQRRDWATFADELPRFRMNDDTQVRCYGLLVQHLKDGAQAPATLADDVRRLWFAQRDAEDACTLAASRLLTEGSGRHKLGVADVWRKARLAMEANRPRAVTSAVEMVAPEVLPLIAEMNASPTRFLTKRVTVVSRMRRELIGLALIKLATSDPDNAASLLENKWGPQLSSEERNWIWGVLGRQAAQRLDPAALDHFRKVSRDEDLTDDMLAWKARAALRAGPQPEWKTLVSAIGAMGEVQAKDPTWQYWRARALLARGGDDNRAEATQLLEGIASPRGFYEQLALEELGRKVTAPARPAPLTAEEREAARGNPSLARGLYAISIGLRSDGVREWNYGTNLARPGGMGDRELLAAAQLACEREVWDRCINTSDRTRAEFDIEQRYPMPFRDSVVRRARDIGLDPAYVYGLIRQESRFVMDARSHVGASGLMQVMPATARWTARKLGMNGFTPDQLTDRDTNIAIGTGYLKLVLDDFSGSMALAAAAYNAGPNRPRAWRNGPVMDAAAWAENVPFGETRDYVKKVLANTTMYAAILSGQPQSLKARLGTVGPRDARTPEPNADLP